ncbi:hypothetical protein C7378_2315 [Acidipila rosea]|uniref:Glycosyl hydrolase family 71 n=1 Tax=Acidipila rosea TaxID=768535 RepID=A0A4R1L3U6_9BACT|nr:hypothetical protein C7378_2315 [Acidipila rosea]
MLVRASTAFLSIFLLFHGCSSPSQPVQLKYKATGGSPELLAVYEAWFGQPNHMSVSYSSHDPEVIRKQIHKAKEMGISGFVVDWFGDRSPYIDQNYALVQGLAAKNKFHVAMMYDETSQEEGATDEVIADFTMFHDTYLTPKAPGHDAYLTYQGRPVIFIFPNGGHTDWSKVRNVVNKWNPAPLLIQENLPGQYADAFDGFYPWINPGPKKWAPDGSNWGDQYLTDFYQTMGAKYPDKIIVGGAWAQFDDSKASWSLNRHISARCGQTFKDTFSLWKKFFPADQIIPFMLVETWNDYEEGSAIEPGIPACGDQSPPKSLKKLEKSAPTEASAGK